MGILAIITQVISILARVLLQAALVAFEVLHALALALIEFIKRNKQWSWGFLCGAATVGGIWYFIATEFDDEEIPRPVKSYTVSAVEAATGNVIVIKRGLLGRRRGAVTLSKIAVPELGVLYGPEARNALNDMVAGREIRVDRYPDDVEWSGICYTPEGLCTQQELVRRGLAWTTDRFWKQEEQEAKRNKRGIWSIHADQEK